MNLVINDMDMPLIIKVASIPKERMQVYFIDNDDYFKRKATYTDENAFEDTMNVLCSLPSVMRRSKN